jgi:hypothetical protein
MLNRDSAPPKAQRVIVTVFLSTTIVLTILTVYTVYTYFQMFSAVRAFSVEINELTFNASNATLKTTISVQNPSQAPFDVLYVEEWVAVGGMFIRNTGVYMQNHPLKLPPEGNLTIPIEADVSTKIPEITARLKQNWQVQIRLRLRGFLVGEFFHEEWLTTLITE